VSEALLLLVYALIPMFVGFVPAYVGSFRLGPGFRVLAVLVSPVAFYLLEKALAALGVFGYEEQCSEECWGNLALIAAVGLAWIGWELGVFGGWLHARLRSRRRAAVAAATAAGSAYTSGSR
jgi:uncharacterized membrane protein